MVVDKEIKSLESYVTYRQLFDDGKRDVYFVISQFAENVIMEKKLYSFGITELTEEIKNQFGFEIPEYVVQSSIRRLNYVQRSNHVYIVDVTSFPTDENGITENMKNASNKSKELIDSLVGYVEQKRGALREEQIRTLVRDFTSFLLDNSLSNGFSDLISAFILENEHNEDFQAHLLQIKEGAVLFAGLNYNSNISDTSAWKNEIIIYVENEILFHLAGYNGSVFKKLAEDLFSLINEMNLKSKHNVIKVRYFEEVFDEINDFFDKAIDIVDGKEYVSLENYAMSEIVKDCKSSSDVISKKTAFYSLLRNKSILKEEKRNYYTASNHEYNLESPETIAKYNISDDKLRYIKHLNYVNILRKGKYTCDLRKSNFIVLTETGKMLKMAMEFADNKAYAPLAINMNVLTNRLWYDLNKGFGASAFPSTFDVILKSRIVLSKILTQNVADKFDEAKQKFYSKEIDEEQLADNILMLREEVKRPEDIKVGDLEDVLSFISEDKLAIYKSEKETLQSRLRQSEKEKTLLVSTIRKGESEREEMRTQAELKNKALKEKNNELNEQRKEDLKLQISDIEQRKEKADSKISKKLKISKYFIICVVVLYYASILFIFLKSNETMQIIIPMLLTIIPPAISIVLSLQSEKRIDFLELYERTMRKLEEKYTLKFYDEYSINPVKLSDLKQDLSALEIIHK